MKLLFKPTDDLLLRLGIFKLEQEEKYEAGKQKFYKGFYGSNGDKLSVGWLKPKINLPEPSKIKATEINKLIGGNEDILRAWFKYQTEFLPKVVDTIKYLDNIIPIVDVSIGLGSALILTSEDANIFSTLLSRELIPPVK
jgi:hypothetical protein